MVEPPGVVTVTVGCPATALEEIWNVAVSDVLLPTTLLNVSPEYVVDKLGLMRFVPVSVTETFVPINPDAGLALVTVGGPAAWTRNVVEASAVAVVTVIGMFPVVAVLEITKV